MKIFLFLVFIVCSTASFGQVNQEDVVRQFGDDLQNWCSTRKYNFYTSALEQCVTGCRVIDKIMEDFARNNGYGSEHYVIPQYFQCFQEAMGKGSLNVSMNSIRTVHENEQTYASHTNSSVEQERQRSKDVSVIVCNIVTNGELNYNVKDVFYVRKGKILKILPYEEDIDVHTGKKKVKVDFSDLVKEHSVELSYGYSTKTPLNISLHTNFSYFNIGVEYGQSFSNVPLYSVNHTNFATSTIDGKYIYLLATPGVYLHYASIDCGLGGIFTKYNYQSIYSSYSQKNTYFMMKPKVTFYIPIFSSSSSNGKVYLSPHVAYQYIPNFNKLNSWEFGIGVRVNFETY